MTGEDRRIISMNPVIVRNVKIGEGMPKICVPIVGKTTEEIIKIAESFQNMSLDLVEWRADWFEKVFDYRELQDTLERLRKVLGEIPILFTFRTAKEGGEKGIEREQYFELNRIAAESGMIDLLDVEIFSEEEIVYEIIKNAHDNGIKVIASNHDFQKTPEKEEILSRLMKMQDMGADILKIAVMPQSKKDVLTLLAATEEMVTDLAKKPVVTISMAGTGVVSRIAGEAFGSAMTFGAVEKVSAPGQIPVEELHQILKILHKSL